MLAFTNFLRVWVLPPGLIWVLFVTGLLLLKSRPRLGRAVLVIGLLAGYVCSLGWFARGLARWWDTPLLPVAGLASYQAQAIVVLGAGGKDFAPEYGRSEVSSSSLTRARYGAFLQRNTGLPLLFTGVSRTCKEAEVMAQVAREMGCPDERIWTEGESATTLESAQTCAGILAGKQIQRVFLVTEAFHMPRSVRVFRSTGLDVVAAPTDGPSTPEYNSPVFWVVPTARDMLESSKRFEEMLGTLVYGLKGAFRSKTPAPGRLSRPES